MTLRRAACLVLAAMLWGAAPPAALAQDAAPQRSVVTLPLQDLPPADTLFDRMGRMIGSALGMIFADGGAEAARPDGTPSRTQQREDFVALMEVAGFGLREIETSIGLIPSARLTFGHARELTDADRDHVERYLERHAQRHGGPMSRVQRAIVGAVLSASEIGEFSVERVEIDLYPLPQIRMALVPRDAPMSYESGRVARSIDRLSERLQAPPALHGKTELLTRGLHPPMRAVGLQQSH